MALPFIVLFTVAVRPILRRLIDLAQHTAPSEGSAARTALRGPTRLLLLGVPLLALAPFIVPVFWLLAHIGSPEAAWSGLHASAPEWGHTALLLVLALPCHLLVAHTLANRLADSPRRDRWILLCGFLLAVPAPLQGAGLIACWNHPLPWGWVYDSPTIVLHAWLLRALPFTALLALAGRLQQGPEWDEAADLESARSWRRFWQLELPGRARWWGATAGLAAVLSLGEIGASVLVVPPGWDTITVRFFTLIHYSLYADVAVLCLALMAAALLLSTWGFRITRETSP